MDRERGRPRAGLEQLAVRGQRRVRARDAPRRSTPRPTRPAGCSSASRPTIGEDLADELLDGPQETEAEIVAQRERVARLRDALARVDGPARRTPGTCWRLADDLVRQGVWIIGGDGWAYDIGFGGLDHVLSSGRNVNILVLDTEVYSNTGGQASKATPRRRGRQVRRRRQGHRQEGPRGDRRAYGNVYVAQVAMGANDLQTTKALLEADAWPGPSLVIAYSTCIAHGIDMSKSMSHQKDAVSSGYWPLYRFQPTEVEGGSPFKLDSTQPSIPVRDFVATEARFAILQRTASGAAPMLADLAAGRRRRALALLRAAGPP